MAPAPTIDVSVVLIDVRTFLHEPMDGSWSMTWGVEPVRVAGRPDRYRVVHRLNDGPWQAAGHDPRAGYAQCVGDFLRESLPSAVHRAEFLDADAAALWRDITRDRAAHGLERIIEGGDG